MTKQARLQVSFGTAILGIIVATPARAIDCIRGLQSVNGQLIPTPYWRSGTAELAIGPG
jgi:hypothetical protein